MKTALMHLGLAFGLLTTLVAEDAANDKEPRAARGRVAWFVATGMPEGMENPITVMSGNDLVEVTLSKRSPSEPVKIPQDGILKVVRKVEGEVGPGKPLFLTLAQATVNEGVAKALIILIPIAQPRGDLIFNATVHDLAKFKGGDWMFLNLTNVNVGVDMGKTNLEIKPGQTRIFDSPVLSEPLDMPIRYRYFHPVQADWKMLSASTIVLYPTRREICIFSIDPRYKRIEYHGITFPVS